MPLEPERGDDEAVPIFGIRMFPGHRDWHLVSVAHAPDPRKLVFIGETGTATNMERLYGRAKRGKRVIGRIPWGHWKTVTFVAALRQKGMTAPFVIDRPMNGLIFVEYVRQCLMPTLRLVTLSTWTTSLPTSLIRCTS